MLDIVYYSNFCDHCKRLLQYLVKNGMAENTNFICIDNRRRDEQNNNLTILLDSGKRVMMPPNIHSVPAVLLPQQNYRVLSGFDEITQHYDQFILKAKSDAIKNHHGL